MAGIGSSEPFESVCGGTLGSEFSDQESIEQKTVEDLDSEQSEASWQKQHENGALKQTDREHSEHASWFIGCVMRGNQHKRNPVIGNAYPQTKDR
jgi:hypothetical protein